MSDDTLSGQADLFADDRKVMQEKEAKRQQALARAEQVEPIRAAWARLNYLDSDAEPESLARPVKEIVELAQAIKAVGIDFVRHISARDEDGENALAILAMAIAEPGKVHENMAEAHRLKMAYRVVATLKVSLYDRAEALLHRYIDTGSCELPQAAAAEAPFVPPADEKAIVELSIAWKQRRDQLREAIQMHKDNVPETLCLAFNCWLLAEIDTGKAKALRVARPPKQFGEPTNAADYHNIRVHAILDFINGDGNDIKGAAGLALPILQRFAKAQFIDPEEIAARKWDAMNLLRIQIEALSGQPNRPAPPNGPPPTELTAVERALMLYAKNPKQTLRELARQVGCNPSLLSRDERIQRMREAHAGRIRKGRKSKEGDLEAEDEEE